MFLAAIGIYILFIIFQIIYIIIPFLHLRKTTINKDLIAEKPISILIPAFNEQGAIHNCVNGIMNLDYSNYEAIFINDGSTDDTLDHLNLLLRLRYVRRKKANKLKHNEILAVYQSSLNPKIFVIDKLNGGKADALNAGLEISQNDIVVTLDADSILASDSLKEINLSFEDRSAVAASGMVHIVQSINNKSEPSFNTFKVSNLVRFQVIQYLVNFYLYKITQAKFKAITVIPGALGIFKRNILFFVGGYRHTVGEDMDMTLRIQILIRTVLKKAKIIFIPEAVCYTECPEGFKYLYRQRIRWQKAFVDCILTYGKLSFARFKISAAIYLIIDSLFLGTIMAFPTIIIPIIIVISGTGYLSALFFIGVTLFVAITQSILALILCRKFGHGYSLKDTLRCLIFIPVEIVSYRLLGLLFTTAGTILYFINKSGWDKIKRSGKQYAIGK